MAVKSLPFNKDVLERIIERYPTPFHIYDEKAIEENALGLIDAFKWVDGFKQFFAVKANPNPHLLKLLKGIGFGADCSSLTELILAERTGIRGEDIMFSSNDTPAEEFVKARELGALINLDDITHIPFLEESAGLPEVLSFRYNPGPLRGGNAIIGVPEESKYGFTGEQLEEGYRRLKDSGVKRFGLHTMIASNELDPQYFIDTAVMLFRVIADLSKKLDIRFEFVNLGGGFGIPYRPEEEPLDLGFIGRGIEKAYNMHIKDAGLHPLRIYTESGRLITGPYGYLVTRVLHRKNIYKQYIGVDACMANLMRPGIYGAYHHITVMGKEDRPSDHVYDVTGSLCENNDKFAVDRQLPEIDTGDIVVIHDTGAHGHAMGFNYNGKLRSAELLLKEDGSIEEIRRAETVEDYLATIDFSRL